MLQAIFFDFDGVIVDSEPLHLRAYQTVLEAEGISLNREDYYARYLGYDDVGLFQALARDRGIAIDTATIDRWIDAKSAVIETLLGSKSVLFPDAAECIRAFADRVPLAVASGALAPEIEMVLEHAGLRSCFRAIASASDGVRGKPAPDLYLLAMAKLRSHIGGPPAAPDLVAPSCVAIEDSRWGLEAARHAGLRTIAVAHTYAAGELQPADLIVERLADLTMDRVEGILRDNGRAQ